jgi:ribokinase
MKILVFGSINIDLVFSVDHIVRPGETIDSGALERSAGGKGANQAAALAKAGMPVYLAGKAGGDGDFLIDLLGSYGVNTDLVLRYEGATGQALVQVDKRGQNAIVLYGGGNHRITGEEAEGVLSRFGAGDYILLQNEITLVGEIISGAKERGLKVCFNPSPFNQGIEKLPLDRVDIFFVNQIEGAALAGLSGAAGNGAADILDRLTRRFPSGEIVLTAGREGAYYGFGEKREKAEIVDLPVVDTTGAGDTFTGYFLAARFRGFSEAEALSVACGAASIAVSQKGAMASIPRAEEVFIPGGRAAVCGNAGGSPRLT